AKLEPTLVLISKHDLWPNFLRACQALQVPVLLINAHFSQKGWRKFPVILAFRKSLLKMVNEVWTVSSEDADLVRRWTKGSVLSLVIGDMRYDQVLQRAQVGQERFRHLKDALGSGLIGVLGSSWEKEERLVWQAWKQMKSSTVPSRLIIVPHEWNEKRLTIIEREFKNVGGRVVRFSQWIDHPLEIDILIVDKMGILSEIYALGDWAFVGGGFGRGVHSVLEPAAHGIPVLFGPHHEVSHEATLLIQEGGGKEIRTLNDLITVWERWLNDPLSLKESGRKALKVVRDRAGATEIAFQMILERLR
ncbi:MAG: 3-deoxy-D-manno-octulosonic acid transferase, partial [bacterium]